MVARVLPFCASSCIATDSARAASRTRRQTSDATLSATDSGHGSWQDPSTMGGARSALLPVASGFRLSATQARCDRCVMSRASWWFDLLPHDAAWGHAIARYADGLDLHYVRQGHGSSAVLLLHGWPGFWVPYAQVPEPAGSRCNATIGIWRRVVAWSRAKDG